MLELALCDDEKEILPLLRGRIKAEFAACGEAVSITSFHDPAMFLEQYAPGRFSIVFLDIDMPGISGTRLANEIIKQDENQIFLFITNRDDLVYEVVRDIHPFGFIRKSSLDEDLPLLVPQLIHRIERENHAFFFRSNKAAFRIPVKDILYFESDKHNVTLYAKGRAFLFTGTLSRIEQELAPYGFIRSHSGFLLNCSYIFSIEPHFVVLDDGRRLPVSRNRISSLKRAFHRKMRNL